MNRAIPILVITGPTATGKSDLAVRVARYIVRNRPGGFVGAEIVSADSRQVYRGLNIGTGKITRKEMCGIKHHLLDVADPRRRFSAERYRRLASKAFREIARRGHLPIICGGTGFYIDSVMNENRFPRAKADLWLRARLSSKTAPQLLIMLAKLDPIARTIWTQQFRAK